jgi:hypothetical protein
MIFVRLANNMTRISPALKGLITAALMIANVLVIYAAGENADPRLQYLIYALYGGGIIWTLISYRRSPAFTGRFGGLFNQGFRCFIIVTLVMVMFTGLFSYLHPEFAEESGEAYRISLQQQKDGNRTPAQVMEEVADYKKQYTLRLVSVSIFGYLIIGVVVTAVASLFLMRRN